MGVECAKLTPSSNSTYKNIKERMSGRYGEWKVWFLEIIFWNWIFPGHIKDRLLGYICMYTLRWWSIYIESGNIASSNEYFENMFEYIWRWWVLLGYIYEGDGSGYWDISLDFLTLVERNENSLSWNLFFMKWKKVGFSVRIQ